VEVFADGGRLHDLVHLDIGAVLHPEDLAADKVLAFWVALALATTTTSMPSSTTSAPNDSWNSPPRKTSDSPR